jgi:hypothetical protein
MGQILDTPRTLLALQPELEARFRLASSPFFGTVRVETDRGSVMMSLQAEQLAIISGEMISHYQADETLILPQTTLVRLVLGAFVPRDFLMRSCPLLSPQVRSLLAALFPLRPSHLYPPDRGVA